MIAFPSLIEEQLQAVCDVLGDTNHGLTGLKSAVCWQNARLMTRRPGLTKRHRLYKSLSIRQRQDRCANNVFAFIQAAMMPVRYTNKQDQFYLLRDKLNKVLSFAGYKLGEDGSISIISTAKTLAEADERQGDYALIAT